jgi:hypothetical protein
VDYITIEVEEDNDEDDEASELEGEGHVGTPPHITEYLCIEQLMDVPDTTIPAILVTYPKSTRELRSLSYGTIGPASKKMSRKLRGLQRNHVAYINKQVLSESKDKAYQSIFAMIQADIHSVAGDTSKNYKHKYHAGWWASMKQ